MIVKAGDRITVRSNSFSPHMLTGVMYTVRTVTTEDVGGGVSMVTLDKCSASVTCICQGNNWYLYDKDFIFWDEYVRMGHKVSVDNLRVGDRIKIRQDCLEHAKQGDVFTVRANRGATVLLSQCRRGTGCSCFTGGWSMSSEWFEFFDEPESVITEEEASRAIPIPEVADVADVILKAFDRMKVRP